MGVLLLRKATSLERAVANTFEAPVQGDVDLSTTHEKSGR
jgi:hypothetical protein